LFAILSSGISLFFFAKSMSPHPTAAGAASVEVSAKESSVAAPTEELFVPEKIGGKKKQGHKSNYGATPLVHTNTFLAFRDDFDPTDLS
jgi:hypothetical protein